MYLSSYRIPETESLRELLGKDFVECRVALIPNAKDYYADRARLYKMQQVINDLETVGFRDIDVVDLRQFNLAEELEKSLKRYELVWAAGGNTFCLRQAMEPCQFGKVLKKLLNNGVVYGGDSAGAIVVGPTLKGVESADVPEFADQIIWDGLKIINCYILPHADNLEFSESLQAYRKLHARHKDYYELNDNQVLIINDQKKHTIDGAYFYM